MASHDPLYLQIAESIADSIRAGALVRGERLHSVRDVARTRGVSMATVVQAYRSLEDARLIEARPRSGYFVAARPAALPEPETSRPPAKSQRVDVGALAATVMAASGARVHVVSTNDYLAERDCEEMAPLFGFFGMTAGVVNESTTWGGNAYSSAMFYVITYVLTTLGTFGMIILLSRQGHEAEEAQKGGEDLPEHGGNAP